MTTLTIDITNIYACRLEALAEAKQLVEDAYRMRRTSILRRFRQENPILGWTMLQNGEKGAYIGFSENLNDLLGSFEDNDDEDIYADKVYNPELRDLLTDEDNPLVFFDPNCNTATGMINQDALTLGLY